MKADYLSRLVKLFFRVVVSLFIATALPFFATAQVKIYSGKVTDEKHNSVPYVNVVFKLGKKGLVSNGDGEYQFSYSEHDLHDSIYVSAIGYETVRIKFTQLLSDTITILPTKKYELFPVTVSAKGAEKMVLKAIEKIPDNYPQTPYFIELFFRQFHRENGKPARLIEAALNVYDPGYIEPNNPFLKEQFEIKELRRSNVFERNGFVHGDHLVDLFMQNIVHYPRGTILNSSAVDFFHFENDEIQNSDTITAIKFFYQNPSDPKIRWGKVYINNNDYAILRVEESTTKNTSYNPRLAAANNSEWKFFEGQTILNYKQVLGTYYLDSISFFYRHNIVNKIFGSTDYVVDEYFNFWTGMPDTIDVSSKYKKNKFQNTSNLYSRKYSYNSEFWKKYGLLNKHPLDFSIISEFEKGITLDEQYLNSETP
jgi:hypothetical protein